MTSLKAKQFSWLFSHFLLLFFLIGCGKAADTSGLAGDYMLVEAEDHNIRIQESFMDAVTTSISLREDGTGTVSDQSGSGRIVWTYDGSLVSIRAGSLLLHGHFAGNELKLQTNDTDTVLTYRRIDYSLQPQKESFTAQKFLGDWYGWWRIEKSEGTMPESWYDCFARFLPEEQDTIRFVFWDEHTSFQNPLSEIIFSLESEESLKTQDGYFLFTDIAYGDWQISMSNDSLALLHLQHYSNDESFVFSIVMRRWGEQWSDENQMYPFYYEDWMLPLMQENDTMPDSIPWQELEKARES